MTAFPIERSALVSFLKEVLKEDPSILNDVLEALRGEEDQSRSQKVKDQIESDFERFDDVFKALA